MEELTQMKMMMKIPARRRRAWVQAMPERRLRAVMLRAPAKDKTRFAGDSDKATREEAVRKMTSTMDPTEFNVVTVKELDPRGPKVWIDLRMLLWRNGSA